MKKLKLVILSLVLFALSACAVNRLPVPIETPQQISTAEPENLPTPWLIAPVPNQIDCSNPKDSANEPVSVVMGADFCIIWNDTYQNENGFRIFLRYGQGTEGEVFVYQVGPDITQLIIPEEHAPRLFESSFQYEQRHMAQVEVFTFLPEGLKMVGKKEITVDLPDFVQLPTATPTLGLSDLPEKEYELFGGVCNREQCLFTSKNSLDTLTGVMTLQGYWVEWPIKDLEGQDFICDGLSIHTGPDIFLDLAKTRIEQKNTLVAFNAKGVVQASLYLGDLSEAQKEKLYSSSPDNLVNLIVLLLPSGAGRYPCPSPFEILGVQ